MVYGPSLIVLEGRAYFAHSWEWCLGALRVVFGAILDVFGSSAFVVLRISRRAL